MEAEQKSSAVYDSTCDSSPPVHTVVSFSDGLVLGDQSRWPVWWSTLAALEQGKENVCEVFSKDRVQQSPVKQMIEVRTRARGAVLQVS